MSAKARTAALLAVLLVAAPAAAGAQDQVAATPARGVETVSGQEPASIQKVEAARSFGLQVGGAWIQNTLDGDLYATGGGVNWFFDSRALFIDVSVAGYWAKGTQQVVGGFGGYLPLTKGTFAPYAGAGLRYAWTNYGHNGSHGLQPYAAAGVLLGRLSSVALRGQLEWWLNTFSNDGKTASGATWSLGVQF